jgi:RHH-type proline utilization regulon transcriptional repressor/proline dehydrogenase/delta 1-pyrroline-5-carboxylate dehydrogenase
MTLSATTSIENRDSEIAIEQEIHLFGRAIFASLGSRQPAPYEGRYWNNLLMGWSMHYPDFKVNLFRLVDVLPTLRTSAEIAHHVTEYLGPPLERIHPSLSWAVGLSRSLLLRGLTAFFVRCGVRQMASMFIAGDTPETALSTLKQLRREKFAFTVDLLGEFCVCESEALQYQRRYLDALSVFGRELTNSHQIIANHLGEASPVCISVKLSALYSQTGVLNFNRSVEVLSDRLSEIVQHARHSNALMYVDAEDSGNNAIIYEVFKRVFSRQEFASVPLPGIVIQGYSVGAESLIDDLLTFAHRRGSPIAIRLVKGAYWDYERVICDQNHWKFPLWNKKETTDAIYERLTRKLLDNHSICVPAFGSHNIRSLAHACCYAKQIGLSPRDFEIQVLYGLADPIAQAFRDRGYLVRMYVPLGEILPGMGYFVRRLLENTSNESFLRHTFFDEQDTSVLLRKPHIQLHDQARRLKDCEVIPNDRDQSDTTRHQPDSHNV